MVSASVGAPVGTAAPREMTRLLGQTAKGTDGKQPESSRRSHRISGRLFLWGSFYTASVWRPRAGGLAGEGQAIADSAPRSAGEGRAHDRCGPPWHARLTISCCFSQGAVHGAAGDHWLADLMRELMLNGVSTGSTRRYEQVPPEMADQVASAESEVSRDPIEAGAGAGRAGPERPGRVDCQLYTWLAAPVRHMRCVPRRTGFRRLPRQAGQAGAGGGDATRDQVP